MTTPLSFRSRTWSLPDIPDSDLTALTDAGVSADLAPVLARRGIGAGDVAAFLAPAIRDQLPNPSFFQDMDRAADRLARAIQAGESIAIWSDYDVDGATSAATLGRFLRDCRREDFSLTIPDRISEGYGPNADGLERLAQGGAEVVFILDAGTVAHAPLEHAAQLGLDVVVIDHHAAEDTLPPAVAIVNPNRRDQAAGYGHVCAAGMTFMLVVATNLRLRRDGWFDGGDGRPDAAPDLMSYLDLVALGTICDVVPLTGINRAFVAKGLPVLSERRLPGIAALAAAAGARDAIDAGTCGFGLGPRINAGGRIGQSDAGAWLLLETDAQAADAQADELDRLNRARQDMEKACTAAAMEQVRESFTPGVTRRLAVAVTDAHEGIVGISAARLKESLDAPSFVLTQTQDGLLKGSGRSVSGFDLGAAILKARHAGLLVKGGGHAMAGGITIDPAQLDAFIAFVDSEIARSTYATTGVVSKVDLALEIGDLRLALIERLEDLAPFGMGNPSPRVMLRGARLADVRVLKDKHLKCLLEGETPWGDTRKIDALMWNAAATPFADALRAAQGTRIDALGALEINEWNGRRRIQLKIEDARPAAEHTSAVASPAAADLTEEAQAAF